MEIKNAERKWIIKEPGNPADVRKLSQELSIDPVLGNLLVQRGIKNYDQAKAFFRPELSMLHNPFLMRDMDLAVERLHNAILNGENILIYGDYDVDVTTAVALVYSFLITIANRVDYYFSDRYDEGYGTSYIGIDWAEAGHVSLIIFLGCGFMAID